ncbi:MAG: hypothetical protein M1823_004793 [Watsoniomyces obsoletus]|nr:MAG: hypothetical protein M1823_004793 [Watsoniomyces obsoletus]
MAPPRRRYPYHWLRRVCTVTLGSLLIAATVLFLLPGNQLRSLHGVLRKGWHQHQTFGQEDLEKLLLSTPLEERLRNWSAYYTSGPHLAGKNLSQALWTRDRWKEYGIDDTSIVSYDVYLNYPAGHRLALLEKNSSSSRHTWDVTYEARLEEDVLEEDHTSGLSDRIPTFHGYSANGNVTASYVYANYGSYRDFSDLQDANVSLTGKIALVKYGHVFRGLKVKRAQDLGMVGVIMYSDPGDDGNNTIEHGVVPYPKGPARQPSSVQRGSVQFMSVAPGDPTTPGYPSKPGVPRVLPEGAIPSIPSIPISYEDALPLLRALNGHGPSASSFNKFWQSGGLQYRGVDYNVGPSPSSLAVNLVNQQEYVTTPIWNVVGVINGSLSDEVIILGNHRDAWIAGGAGDPNSGSAALNELVWAFGEAWRKGWRPLRTMVFCSWDGEETGLVGSTEWVEEYLPWLSGSAVAYVNVDIGVSGPRFSAAASPLLHAVLEEATGMVPSPNQTIEGQTVRDVWDRPIRTMGSGSDFTAFQDYAGIPSVDFGFKPGADDPVYHYHSNYDSFDWMDRFGDPGWHYHATVARVFGLVAAKLAMKPVIPFRAANYSDALIHYLDAAKSMLHDEHQPSGKNSSNAHHVSFRSLDKALQELNDVAIRFDESASILAAQSSKGIPWWKWWTSLKLVREILKTNRKYKFLERHFLYDQGLDGRSWFKHVVFAPGLWTGYSGATYPGLLESIESRNWTNAERWVDIITTRVHAATKLLE